MTEESIRKAFQNVLSDKDVNLVVELWRGDTAECVAARYKLTPGRVRHMYFRSIELLRGRPHAGDVFEALFLAPV